MNGIVTRNPNTMVDRHASVALAKSGTLRGTIKLRAALAGFGVSLSGRVCLDVGAAAGGFTAALLEAGARRVFAVDAGYGQLAGWLRQDPRVVNLERTNLAYLSPALIPEPVAVICMDLSYLAIVTALPQLGRVPRSADAQLMALVKPTFELGTGRVVDDGEAIGKAVAAATGACVACGWTVHEETVAVRGRGGAAEVFIHCTQAQQR